MISLSAQQSRVFANNAIRAIEHNQQPDTPETLYRRITDNITKQYEQNGVSRGKCYMSIADVQSFMSMALTQIKAQSRAIEDLQDAIGSSDGHAYYEEELLNMASDVEDLLAENARLVAENAESTESAGAYNNTNTITVDDGIETLYITPNTDKSRNITATDQHGREWVTITQLATNLGRPRSTVYEWRRAGKLGDSIPNPFDKYRKDGKLHLSRTTPPEPKKRIQGKRKTS